MEVLLTYFGSHTYENCKAINSHTACRYLDSQGPEVWDNHLTRDRVPLSLHPGRRCERDLPLQGEKRLVLAQALMMGQKRAEPH